MKKIALTSLLALFLAFPVFAQDEVENVELPDAVMEQVVRRIVTWYFKPRSRPTEIYISAHNIKKEWLPSIRNIRFVLVPDGDDGSDSGIYFFRPVQKDGRAFSIGFGYGDPSCHNLGDIWSFRVVSSRIRLTTALGQFGSHCSPSTGGVPKKQ